MKTFLPMQVKEDLGLIAQVKSFFTNHNYHHPPPPPPNPALSAHSTSDPAASSAPFPSPLFTPLDHLPPGNPDPDLHYDDDDPDGDLQDDDQDPSDNSDPETELPHEIPPPTELMQLDMSEAIPLASPDDASNQFNSSNFNFAGAVESSTQRWRFMTPEADDYCGFQPPRDMEEMETSLEDTHYSQTVSAVLQNHRVGSASMPTSSSAGSGSQSAFATWTDSWDTFVGKPTSSGSSSSSQRALKYILFHLPYLHNKYREENAAANSSKSGEGAGGVRLRKANSQDELSANHVMAERRRREKLNERFVVLRSLVPFVTKMDKASILGDTIEYLKQLRKKIQELEGEQLQASRDGSRKQRSGGGPRSRSENTKMTRAAETSVEVSIIEKDALLEVQCEAREGLLLDMMQKLREMRIEVTAVQSSLADGVLVAELRAKVKESGGGKKVSIVEVKRALHGIIHS